MTLLGNLKGSAQVFQDTEFYNGVVSTSGRFDNSSSSYLNRTVAAGNRKTWTLSFWFKRCDIARDQDFLTATGSGATGLWANMITSGDKLQVYGNNQVLLLSNQLLRDTSAWYNIIFRCDTTQSTASNRLKIYLNGSEITSFETDNRANLTQDGDFGISSNVDHHIGANQTPGNYLDGYLAEYNFTDGVSNEPTAFGETKNGVWIPIEYTGSYGTYGFRLKFDGFLGTDTSGNGNNWTPNGFSAEDTSMPDCPENNFATMNPLVQTNDAAGDLSEGNLKITKSGTTYSFFQSTFGVRTGKWYAEIRCNAKTDVHFMIGVTEMNMETYRTGDSVDPHLTAGTVWYSDNGYGHYDGSGVSTSTFSNDTGFNAGQVVGIALDLDSGTRTVKFYVDGSLVTTQNLPSSMVDHIGFACNWYNAHTGVWNFGQDSTIAGEETAGGNSDGNGIGDFHTSVPSGYLALCTSNFDDDNFATIGPDSATQADDHFNTVLWTGNASSRSITGVGFQPDWVWFKPRSDADNHVLIDSSRGGTKYLMSNRTDAEITEAQGISSFDSDGFSIGNWTNINENSQTYVAWNWKANGGTTTTNDASATGVGNIDSVIQANTTAGFSIVTYTGNGTDNTDLGIAHGLGVTPKMVWVKNRSTAKSWQVYNSNFSADGTYGIKNALLDSSGGEDAYSDYIKTTSSTTFTIRSDASDGVGRVNKNGDNYVAYCFAEVEGYSKIGIYTANENTDGAFIYLGFRPAWAMIKRTAGNGWAIQDSARSTFNPVNNLLQANESNTEYTTDVKMDFVSNGIKMRNDSGFFNHVAGNSFIYMAFAEAPFKYANGR